MISFTNSFQNVMQVKFPRTASCMQRAGVKSDKDSSLARTKLNSGLKVKADSSLAGPKLISGPVDSFARSESPSLNHQVSSLFLNDFGIQVSNGPGGVNQVEHHKQIMPLADLSLQVPGPEIKPHVPNDALFLQGNRIDSVPANRTRLTLFMTA